MTNPPNGQAPSPRRRGKARPIRNRLRAGLDREYLKLLKLGGRPLIGANGEPVVGPNGAPSIRPLDHETLRLIEERIEELDREAGRISDAAAALRDMSSAELDEKRKRQRTPLEINTDAHCTDLRKRGRPMPWERATAAGDDGDMQ